MQSIELVRNDFIAEEFSLELRQRIFTPVPNAFFNHVHERWRCNQADAPDWRIGESVGEFLQITLLERRSDYDKIYPFYALALQLGTVVASVFQKLTVLSSQNVAVRSHFRVNDYGETFMPREGQGIGIAAGSLAKRRDFES